MLQAEIEGDIAGDPMSTRKWLRRSLRKLQRALRQRGYYLGRSTLRRMLQALGYSLQSNRTRLRRTTAPGSGATVPLPAARAQALPGGRAPSHQRGHEEKRAHRQLQERRAYVMTQCIHPVITMQSARDCTNALGRDDWVAASGAGCERA